MFFSSAIDPRAPAPPQSAVTAWRWRYFDPRTGELVTHSEPLTAEQMLAINPRAELIPGSRVVLSAGWFGNLVLAGD